MAFLLFALSIKINIYSIEISKLVYLVLGMLYLSTLFIIGGIEKEKHTISNPVLLFGLIIKTLYIIYLYILGVNIYKYVIYMFIIIVFAIINFLLNMRKDGKQNYTLQILMLCFYFVLFTMEETVILTIIATLLIISINQMILSHKKDKNILKEDKKIPIGFYLCLTNVIMILLQNYFLI